VATSAYMTNRIKFQRPQAMLFSDNPGTLSSGTYIPNGDEGLDFIILSDHNRQSLSVSKLRIENRTRMINGNLRSYHTADKLNLQVSWNRLPSRAYSSQPTYSNGELDQDLVLTSSSASLLGFNPEEHTVDGGAGGADLLEWYENHVGPFWVFLSYDKFGEGNLNRYTQVVQMYFSDFSYDVEKRGQAWGSGTSVGYDMWNLSLSLEEV
jgi:hypothetical protein